MSTPPTKTTSKRELFQWLANVFQEDLAGMSETRTRSSIPNWDSMGTLLLIAELDERLAVTLTEDDLKGFVSVGDIVALLEQKQITIEDQ
jgi:acyl carrier protein